jgi:hypothetical protein
VVDQLFEISNYGRQVNDFHIIAQTYVSSKQNDWIYSVSLKARPLMQENLL